MGCHFLLQGILLTQESKPMSPASPALAGRFFTTEPPGKSHGQRSLADYSPKGCKELDTTERLNIRGGNKLFKNSFFHQFSSVAQSCATLWDPMNSSTQDLPAHHQLPEFTQTHVRRVGDSIHPSHPQSPPSPPAFNLSDHQSLFQ